MQRGIFYVLAACLLAFLLSLNGCSPLERVVQKATAEQIAGMTPEQIKAWQDAGQAWYVCLQINGPPPAGSGTILIVPRDYVMTGGFGTDCHPTVPPLVLNNGQPIPTPAGGKSAGAVAAPGAK